MTLPLSDEPVVAAHYEDLNTGCIYELDQDPASPTFGEYLQVYCPPVGSVILNGSGPPGSGVGNDGDYYIDNDTGTMYGPKDGSGTIIWPIAMTPGSGAPGPPGPTGPAGPPGPAGSLDTTPPPVPVLKSVASATAQQLDGSLITNIVAVVGYDTPPVGLTDLNQFILQSTRVRRLDDATLPDWSFATQWAVQSADTTGTLDTPITQPMVVSATEYWLRAYAVDKAGNRQLTPSNEMTVTTDQDTEGPPQPSGIFTVPGNNVFAVGWDPNTALDLAYDEVQWRVVGSGASWDGVQNSGTLVVIAGVSNGVGYDVRVRAVDFSGNTLNDTGGVDTDGNPVYETVQVAGNPDKGWVTGPSVTPSGVNATSLVWPAGYIQTLLSGHISADWISGGSIKVGGAPGNVAAITVVDSAGNVIGQWDANGIQLLDPSRPGYVGDPGYKMTIDESGLIIWDITDPNNPVAVVSITPAGIDAASITFGTSRGGHNLVWNSSFELGAFSATATTNNQWDVAADWNAAGSRQGADINLTTGASTLTMTAV